VDDISKKINAYVVASAKAKGALEKEHGVSLESLDIQTALQHVLHPASDNPAYLLDYDLTSERIIELLKDYDFRSHKPELLATIELEEPLIPDGMPRLLTEQTIKAGGEVWRIHKNDADPFPSVPHAHNLDTGAVMHLGTGDLYDKNRKVVKNIGCKALLDIRGKLAKFALPETACR
jgi:hypothetical protein